MKNSKVQKTLSKITAESNNKNVANKSLPKDFAEKVLDLEIKVQQNNPSNQDIQSLLEYYSQGVEYYEAQNNGDYIFFLAKMKKLFLKINPLSNSPQKHHFEHGNTDDEMKLAENIYEKECEKVKVRKRILSKDIESQKEEIAKRLDRRRNSSKPIFENGMSKRIKTMPGLEESIEYEGDQGAGKCCSNKVKRIEQANKTFNENVEKLKSLLEKNPSLLSDLASPFLEKLIKKYELERIQAISEIEKEN